MSLAQTADVEILKTREASPSHFLMKVESFSLLGKYGIHRYESGQFTAGGYKWRLILCQNEDKNGIDSKYVSVHLAISDTNSLQPANWEVNAVFSIFLFNQISGNCHYSSGIVQLRLRGGSTIHFGWEGALPLFLISSKIHLVLTISFASTWKARTKRFMPMKLEWGISNFISKKNLIDPSNGFLMGNNCVFGAEVFVVEKSALSECLSVKNTIVPYKRNWKISNFSKLGDLWTSEEFVAQGINWKMMLHPKGDGIGKGRYLSTFLCLVDSKRVNVHFSICIRDQINNTTTNGTADYRWLSPSHKTWGWSTFLELATLEDPKNGYIKKDCCHLEIEISVQAVV